MQNRAELKKLEYISPVAAMRRVCTPLLVAIQLISSELQLDLGYSSSGIEAFRARSGAVKDCVTPVQAQLILKFILPLGAM